ncbi:MAG: hypothetical protein E4H13_05415, partial [Calditrichales bacterium]
MPRLRSTITLLVLILAGQLLPAADLTNGYQYVFPPPDGQYISPSATIIVRFSHISPADLVNLPEMINVTGAKNGPYAGKTQIASDKRTIIFDPDRNFEPGDTINVLIQPNLPRTFGESVKPLAYKFTVIAIETPKTIFHDDENIDFSLYKTAIASGQARIMSNGVSVPGDFPQVNITQNNSPSGDYIFLNNWGAQPPNYNIIFNISGEPVWYWKTPDRRRDFKIQPNGCLTMLIRDGYGGSGEGFIALNKNYEYIKSFRPTNGYFTDEHEFLMLPDSGYLLIGRRETIVDMAQYVSGGQSDATVRETCIQEFTADDQLIFIWRAWDHFDIRDLELESLTTNYIRFPHMNALDIDEDGNILLSSRHLSEITKINRQNGNIIWRLSGVPGSANNNFQFVNDPLNGFRNQHAIRANGNNRYLLFDNGNLHSPPQSRAVEYELDTEQMTATLVWEFRNDISSNYSYYMGNAQRLPNGNTHINWAVGDALPIASEITPDGEKAFEMWFSEGYHCYRSFRFPWDGMRLTPYLLLDPQYDNLTLLFNKFGDDNVDYYNIYGGTVKSPTALMDTSKSTMKSLRNLVNGKHYYFRVTAVDKNGLESGYSDEADIIVNMIQPGTNIIVNGDFSDGVNSWIWQIGGSASATLLIENGVNHIAVQNGGSQIYDVQLRQIGIPLIQGHKYTFEFDAWAGGPRIAEIKVGQEVDPYTNYSRIGYSALATTPKHFTYTFEMLEPTDTNCRVVINAGTYANDVYIDNLSLKMDAASGIEQNIPQVNQFVLYPNYPNPF